ncbi:transposase [Paenibacillus profundus]|uniref:Transposase n=1 Tax=Paenibacillus profundus TaxID=1173085 RepID=A0ABS8YPA2_9BACL|nr:transposase [Paenibacillus profundus]
MVNEAVDDVRIAEQKETLGTRISQYCKLSRHGVYDGQQASYASA